MRKTEHQTTVRFPNELAARLQKHLDAASANRLRFGDAPIGTAFDVKNVSDVIRKATEIGLDILEGDRDRLRDLFLDMYADELKAVLASAVFDKGARDTLAKLSKKDAPLNFG